jgi:hypothetical protein
VEKFPAGYFVSYEVAQAIHAYLVSRPYVEVHDLVRALQASKPVKRKPA